MERQRPPGRSELSPGRENRGGWGGDLGRGEKCACVFQEGSERPSLQSKVNVD